MSTGLRCTAAPVPRGSGRRATTATSTSRHFHQNFAWGRCSEEWLDSLGSSPAYHLLDLFYWEQRLGCWLSANCLEFDVAWRDFLAPFNVRGLMVDLLACDDSLLAPPDHELLRRIIHAQWPELLAEPVNPRGQTVI